MILKRETIQARIIKQKAEILAIEPNYDGQSEEKHAQRLAKAHQKLAKSYLLYATHPLVRK